MSNVIPELPPTGSRTEQVFPKLTPQQIYRIATYGHLRPIRPGEVLVEQEEGAVRFFVVVTGELEGVRFSGGGETVVAVLGPGQFTGEVNMLSGFRSSFSTRVTKQGELLELDRQSMLALVQADAELGELLIRAFILRRVELLLAGGEDVVVIGSNYSADTLRVKDFLMRNGHPYAYIDLERDLAVQNAIDIFQIDASEIPVVICRGKLALRNPTNQQVVDCLGFNETIH
jgi:thioredoxin reductase (NADPH)